MWVSFSPDQDKPFIADIDGTKYNFITDKKTGFLLLRNMAEPVVNKQNAVNSTIEAKPRSKKKYKNIVELDTENYGAPPANSGIVACNFFYGSRLKTSLTEPQAWEDAYWNWFYNFAGAIQLAKTLGRTLPNIDQLIATINKKPRNFRQSAGHRDGYDGEFDPPGQFSIIWSSSEEGSDAALCASLKHWGSSAGRLRLGRRDGLSVRLIVDKK